jgi:putative tryptophan/tyrosine transport system substrate-binding protein
MRRRDFIKLLGGATVVWPLASRAQQPDQIRRIGVLTGYAESDLEAQAWVTAFVQGLKALGWIVGRNVSIDYRYAEELVGLAPAVILAHTSPAMAALQQATRTIPIVFVDVFAPVGQRFVSNLARPGGNITGFSSVEPEIGGKWLGMLKEVAPLLARVAVIHNPETGPFSPLFLRAIETAAPSFAVKPIATPVHRAADIERAISAFAHDLNGGLIVLPSAFVAVHRQSIFEQAAQHRLPAVYGFRYFAADGGLMSYGVDVRDLFRRSAAYVDGILKGAKPGELPVQTPTKFQLVINLKTAKALGLTLPPTTLAIADEFIE